MFSFSKISLALLPLVSLAVAQTQVWGQCGGIGFTGSTTCGTLLSNEFAVNALTLLSPH